MPFPEGRVFALKTFRLTTLKIECGQFNRCKGKVKALACRCFQGAPGADDGHEGFDMAAGAVQGHAITDDTAGRPAGRRERNKLEKRNRILAAARQLFAERGFADTTTQQIAEAADIGTGTLFLYASSKEDLLVMVFRDEMLETAADSFANLPAGPDSAAQIMTVFGRMVDYHARDADLSRLLLRELLLPSSAERAEDIDHLMSTIYGGLTDIVRRGQAAGTVRPGLDPKLTGRALFAYFYLALISWLGGGLARERCVATLQAQVRQLLSAPGTV
jgi:AcrR family transcriptional regulator